MTVGNAKDARYAAGGFDCSWEPPFAEVIGSGQSRTAYLVDGVVYKDGRDSANRYEHEALTAWRLAGAEWAPETTLYEQTYLDLTYTVLAMPYLPDDGTPPDEATLAAIRIAAPHTCSENWTASGGRTWLIDGVDIQYMPTDAGATPPAPPRPAATPR